MNSNENYGDLTDRSASEVATIGASARVAVTG